MGASRCRHRDQAALGSRFAHPAGAGLTPDTSLALACAARDRQRKPVRTLRPSGLAGCFSRQLRSVSAGGSTHSNVGPVVRHAITRSIDRSICPREVEWLVAATAYRSRVLRVHGAVPTKRSHDWSPAAVSRCDQCRVVNDCVMGGESWAPAAAAQVPFAA